MQLNYSQRINLGNILPVRGNLVTMRISRDCRKKLELTQEDMVTAEMEAEPTEDGAALKWNADKEIPWDKELTDAELGCIKDSLVKASKEETLTDELLDLYDLFVVD